MERLTDLSSNLETPQKAVTVSNSETWGSASEEWSYLSWKSHDFALSEAITTPQTGAGPTQTMQAIMDAQISYYNRQARETLLSCFTSEALGQLTGSIG